MTAQWSTTAVVFLVPVVFFIMFMGIAGNILVVLVLRKQSTRRITGRQFLTNLAVADIGGSANLIFMFVTILFRGKWSFGEGLCQLNGVLAIFFASASMWTLSAISVNRYVRIVRHAFYTRIFTMKTTAFALALTWFVPLVMSVAPLLGWSSHEFQFGKCSCHFFFSTSISYTFTFIILIVVIPLKIILFSYFKIYKTTTQHRMALAGHRRNHSSIHVEDIKITKTLFVVILVYMICFIPASLINIVEMARPDLGMPSWLDISSFLLVVSNHANNPLIYGLGNRSLRKAFWSILGSSCNPCLSVSRSVEISYPSDQAKATDSSRGQSSGN